MGRRGALARDQEVVAGTRRNSSGAARHRRGREAIRIEPPLEERENRGLARGRGRETDDHGRVHVLAGLQIRLVEESGRVPVGADVVRVGEQFARERARPKIVESNDGDGRRLRRHEGERIVARAHGGAGRQRHREKRNHREAAERSERVS